MTEKYHLSETEREIMEKLWELNMPVKQSHLLAMFAQNGKEWKRQTLNTYITRLEERGFVSRKNRQITPSFTKEQLQLKIMEDGVNDYYEGRLSNFVAAFARNHVITQKEKEELISMIQNYEEKKTEE